MKGVVSHAVLLAAALVLAWITWSRDERADTGELQVTVWRGEPGSVESVTFATPTRRTVIGWRSQDGERYLWGWEIRRPVPGPAPGADTAEAASPAAPPDTSVFPVAEAGEDLIGRLAPLRALRELGPLDDERAEEFGLVDPADTLVVAFEGEREERLLLGDAVFGGIDRYALAPAGGRVYALPGSLVRLLEGGGARLQDRRLHAFDMSRVDRVVLTTPGSERERVRRGGVAGAAPTWAPPDAPERADATFANFMERVQGLGALEHLGGLSADSLAFLARLEYLDDGGDRLGLLELFRGSATSPEEGGPGGDAFYVRTEHTRVLARTYAPVAERVAEDLEQLFGGGGAPSSQEMPDAPP